MPARQRLGYRVDAFLANRWVQRGMAFGGLSGLVGLALWVLPAASLIGVAAGATLQTVGRFPLGWAVAAAVLVAYLRLVAMARLRPRFAHSVRKRRAREWRVWTDAVTQLMREHGFEPTWTRGPGYQRPNDNCAREAMQKLMRNHRQAALDLHDAMQRDGRIALGDEHLRGQIQGVNTPEAVFDLAATIDKQFINPRDSEW